MLLLLTIFISCKRETYDDVSFVTSAKDPQNLSLLFEITQDNTGLVTITPNGEGVSFYEVYYGDATTVPVKVNPGKATQHNYAEGVYNVKVVAHNLAGKTTEFTKQLTVTFRAPENLQVTTAIDPGNNFKLDVSATALYETNFKVYFGLGPTEVPVSFNEGQNISHIYSAPGNYTVKVIALSGGAATTELTRTITILNPVNLPLSFEAAPSSYVFNNFDGGSCSVIANPQQNGINTSAQVGRMIKNAGQVWGGSWLGLSNAIDFSTNKIFRMKVFSPRAGAKVLLKVENATNPAINYEKEVTTNVANAWEDLVFDYTGINASNAYHNIVLIFELGTIGDGTSNFTFLFDDIRLVANDLMLPLNFESSTLTYSFTNFDGGDASVINNPQANGINTSAKVGRMIKNAGQVWGGSFIALTNPIDFSVLRNFRMKVFSPRANAKVLLKVENMSNGGVFYEQELTIGTANQWVDLSFNFSGINTGNSYQKIVLIFDLGLMGDGSPNYTFLFDDLRLM
jgi:PKD repeat protein